MGPPSSGGTTVGEVLNILGGYNPAGSSREQILHRYLEASRYTFADRNAFLADPAFFDVPRRGPALDLVRRRAARADHREARGEHPVTPGDPYDNQGGAARPAANSATISHPRQSTTHLTVADAQGQRRVLHVHDRVHRRQRHRRAGLRVPAQQRADGLQLRLDDAPEPRGRLQAPAQLDGADDHREVDGKPFLALGSPGGSTIPGTVLQTLVNRIDLREPLPNAIALPRAVERNTATTQAEQAFIDSPEGQSLAVARGHKFAPPAAPGEIGAATAIEFRGKRFIAAAEPPRRGGGSAAVVTPR